MRIEDVEEVASIEKDIFSRPWSANAFKDSLEVPGTIYMVAVKDGYIAGYCGIYTVMNEGNITNVAVKEEYRRLGIAKMLIENIIKRAKSNNVNKVMLEVRESNEPAQKLYTKMGFKAVTIRKNFYNHPREAAIVMLKEDLN